MKLEIYIHVRQKKRKKIEIITREFIVCIKIFKPINLINKYFKVLKGKKIRSFKRKL